LVSAGAGVNVDEPEAGVELGGTTVNADVVGTTADPYVEGAGANTGLSFEPPELLVNRLIKDGL